MLSACAPMETSVKGGSSASQSGTELSTDETPLSTAPLLKTGPFTAEYYNGETLVGSERVERPAANFDHTNPFLNIPPESFGATWTGEIEVAHRALVNVAFDLSYASVTLEIDGSVVATWEELTTSVKPLALEPGIHTVKIRVKSLTSNVRMNVALTAKSLLPAAAVGTKLKPLVTPDVRIIYVGAYESSDFANRVSLRLREGSTPIILIVSSFHAINWNIVNAANLNLRAVIYSSYAPTSTFSGVTSVPTFNVEDIGYASSNFETMASAIATLTGRSPDVTLGAYALGEVSE